MRGAGCRWPVWRSSAGSCSADRAVWIRETVHNPGGVDKPIGWTQHVTLGPPFLEKGQTQFRASVDALARLRVAVRGAGTTSQAGADFDWPHAPRRSGGTADLRVYTDAPVSSAYTAHLTDPARADGVLRGVLARHRGWRSATSGAAPIFPGWGSGKKTSADRRAPWTSRTLTRGMEFGVSPFPETRRAMVERGRLFDTPTLQMDTSAVAGQRRIFVCLHGRRGRPGDTGVAGLKLPNRTERVYPVQQALDLDEELLCTST